jgi:hypothetical protein
MCLTYEQKQEYIKKGGNSCPHCKALDIKGGDVEMDGDTLRQKVVCCECKAEWTDVYTLTDIDEFSSL